HGSWHHELDEQNHPSSNVWEGKPDVYHAYQAMLLPRLGEVTSFVDGATRLVP
ncbi:MAG: AGE family epimerase/isomerase, partial [Actinomycetota bacterium]|nr:AGE family epimerase/isomerase [Actinomycetota bacterium]